MLEEFRIPPEVAEQLRFYVYMYIDPRTSKPFYVGKGQGSRVLAHLDLQNESRKVERLNDLRSEGLSPRIDILVHGLEDEQTALTIEAAVIDALELGALTNEVRGARTGQFGRARLSELLASYAAAPVEIIDPVLLIRINRLYGENMSTHELYEATRGTWVLGRQRERARFASYAVCSTSSRGIRADRQSTRHVRARTFADIGGGSSPAGQLPRKSGAATSENRCRRICRKVTRIQ
jgi:hypothetical protein